MSAVLVLLEPDGNETKYLPTIKKITNLGLSEIKNRIKNGNPIMKIVLFRDEDEDARLKQLIHELTNLGAKIRLFDSEINTNKEITIEYLMNRFNRYRQIQEQNELLDDLMYGDKD
ncbi:hypothetical protein ACPVTF_16080 [Geobacillus icigianus]|uniref:Uncharacterized protein n=1 Tax=Geobacillus subterraneus TaxID=129338 RepID=A0A679FR77_9BACL|nr:MULTISPECIES: hypothetical protein [Geobacillus]KYD24868.1 hypothetical protein B4113_2117 [Geobacillus sp. B4113_201601]BBW98610.1 hypothetical protein GsuE55_34430 [Geobacillus subterraneus]